MLRKKKKDKTALPPSEVNIVSLMDILTTLLFFILMVTSLTKYSIIDATSLLTGTPSSEEKQEFTLQLRIISENKAVIWLGPSDKLKISDKGSLNKFLRRNFKGSHRQGHRKFVKAKNKEELFNKIQKMLVGIKKGFPHENKIVVSYKDEIKYQIMIDTMNAVKSLSKDETAFEVTTLINQDEMTRVLFPSVIISENIAI